MPGGLETDRSDGRKVFFFEKRNKSSWLACGAPHAPGPKTARALAKVFGSFFKKNCPSFSLP
jgi:hypothetical protein